MTPPLVFSDKADHLQIFQFGGFDPNAGWLSKMLSSMSSFSNDIKARIVLRADKVGLEQFKAAGFDTSGEAHTIADLMNPHGSVSCSKSMKAKVFGSDEAYDYVIKCLKEGGFLSKTPPASGTYWFEVLK